MISNWPFLPSWISRTVLAATVDLPTILPLKASFESGPLQRSDHYLKFSCVEKEGNKITSTLRFREKETFPGAELHLSKAIELHLFNKEEKNTLQSKGADDT